MVRLRDESAAEDIVQETLLSAIQSLASYSGKSGERTWLVGILKHKLIDHFRKSSREISFDPSETDLSEFDPLFERTDEFKGAARSCIPDKNHSTHPCFASTFAYVKKN